MKYLKIFFFGFFNKLTALVLSIGIFKTLAYFGLFESLKGEFYFIPAMILTLGMILLFSKYLTEMTIKNLLILLGLFVIGTTALMLT